MYGEKIPLIRLAEMYYILAESVALSECGQYINAVKNARGISRAYDVGTNVTEEQRLEELNKEYGMSIIMVTHDMNSGLNHATKILKLKKEVLFYGTPAEYLCHTNACRHVGDIKHD